MERPTPAARPRDLVDLKRRIDHWRMTRRQRRPMPEDLWQEAARVARTQGISATASALGVNYYGIKDRIEAPPKKDSAQAGHVTCPAFIEVDAPRSLLPPNCEVEVESAGEKMTLRFSGSPAVDVLSLLNAFWRRRR